MWILLIVCGGQNWGAQTQKYTSTNTYQEEQRKLRMSSSSSLSKGNYILFIHIFKPSAAGTCHSALSHFKQFLDQWSMMSLNIHMTLQRTNILCLAIILTHGIPIVCSTPAGLFGCAEYSSAVQVRITGLIWQGYFTYG